MNPSISGLVKPSGKPDSFEAWTTTTGAAAHIAVALELIPEQPAPARKKSMNG
jgi:hypothetical protein